jgi:hypothetical protein
MSPSLGNVSCVGKNVIKCDHMDHGGSQCNNLLCQAYLNFRDLKLLLSQVIISFLFILNSTNYRERDSGISYCIDKSTVLFIYTKVNIYDLPYTQLTSHEMSKNIISDNNNHPVKRASIIKVQE